MHHLFFKLRNGNTLWVSLCPSRRDSDPGGFSSLINPSYMWLRAWGRGRSGFGFSRVPGLWVTVIELHFIFLVTGTDKGPCLSLLQGIFSWSTGNPCLGMTSPTKLWSWRKEVFQEEPGKAYVQSHSLMIIKECFIFSLSLCLISHEKESALEEKQPHMSPCRSP